MPVQQTVKLADIEPPDIPMRASMDSDKLHELADDILANGLINPITLRGGESKLKIIAGHRRFIAAGMAHLTEIAAIVYAPGEGVDEALMLAENLCREDVNDAQIAIWLHELSDKKGYSEEQLCALVKKSADWVGDRYRLLQGDRDVFTHLLEGRINFGVARELNKIREDKWRAYYTEQAVTHGLSAREVANARKHIALNSDLLEQPAPATPAPDSPVSPPPPPMACFVCGGHMDTWNIVTVFIHKHELEQIQRLLAEAAAG